MIQKDDVLVVNPKSILGKSNDTYNQDWKLIVDYVSDRYVYCSQTTYVKGELRRDEQLLQGVLVKDSQNPDMAHCIRRLAVGIGDVPDEDEYIKNNPEEFYTKETKGID
jgi:hypothetical protein